MTHFPTKGSIILQGNHLQNGSMLLPCDIGGAIRVARDDDVFCILLLNEELFEPPRILKKSQGR